jgi:hypothetical protein
MGYQQRLSERKIALVIMEGRTTNLDDLVQSFPTFFLHSQS